MCELKLKSLVYIFKECKINLKNKMLQLWGTIVTGTGTNVTYIFLMQYKF